MVCGEQYLVRLMLCDVLTVSGTEVSVIGVSVHPKRYQTHHSLTCRHFRAHLDVVTYSYCAMSLRDGLATITALVITPS